MGQTSGTAHSLSCCIRGPLQVVLQVDLLSSLSGCHLSSNRELVWGSRGPQGVWTLQRAGKPLPKADCSFATAKPSLTHQARLAFHSVTLNHCTVCAAKLTAPGQRQR